MLNSCIFSFSLGSCHHPPPFCFSFFCFWLGVGGSGLWWWWLYFLSALLSSKKVLSNLLVLVISNVQYCYLREAVPEGISILRTFQAFWRRLCLETFVCAYSLGYKKHWRIINAKILSLHTGLEYNSIETLMSPFRLKNLH